MMKSKFALFVSFMIGFLSLNPCFSEALDNKSKSPVDGTEVRNAKDAEDRIDVKDEGEFFFGYLNLAGTVLISEKNRKLNKAIFTDVFTRKKVTYHEGALLPYGITLKKVEMNRVILEKNKKVQTVLLRSPKNYFDDIKTLRRKGYNQIAPNEWVVNSHYLFNSSESMIKLAVNSGLALKRWTNNPGIEIANDGVKKIAGLGFKKGDKVVDINGVALDGVMGLSSAYEKMKNDENITMKVLRNGKFIELNYWVAKRGAPRYDMGKVFASDQIKKMLSM